MKAWMIEKHFPGVVYSFYWTGNVGVLGYCNKAAFSPVPNHGVKFCNKEDAEKVINGIMGGSTAVIACEHIWE